MLAKIPFESLLAILNGSIDSKMAGGSYLAFRSLLLELLLLGMFLGDASLDRCQGLPRERTEQTSFFL